VGLAIGAASLPIADFRTFFDTGALDPTLSVTLEPEAAARLLMMGVDSGKRVAVVNEAIRDKPPGRVTLSGSDITAVIDRPATQPAPDSHIEPV
jgi:Fe2+ transport system protein FeoA